LSHTVTKVRRAASRIEDPCLSVGLHSAAALIVLFLSQWYNVKEQVEQTVTTPLNSQDGTQVLWHSF